MRPIPKDNPNRTGTPPDSDQYVSAFFGKPLEGGRGYAFGRLAELQTNAKRAWVQGYGHIQRLQRDATRTPEARLLDSARQMRRATEPVTAAWETLRDEARGEIERRRHAMQNKLRPADSLQALQDSEMRRFLLTATQEQRQHIVSEARRSGDLDTVRAIASMPAYLSGVGSPTHAALRDEYLSAVATDDWTEVRALEEALPKAERAIAVLQEHAQHYVDFDAAAVIEANQFQEDAA